jgi:FkbM family methyltransferase
MDQKIKLKFGNGEESIIDEEIYKLIINLKQKAKNSEQLPFFWNLSKSLEGYNDIFLQYYRYMLSNYKLSKSQLYQDLFVLFNFNEKKNGTFLEFGATDGIEFSNSFVLENKFNWYGVLAEPSPQWHERLKQNRPNCKIIKECIYDKTGKNLDFFVSEEGVLSTLKKYKQSDLSSMPGNTDARNRKGYYCKVNSISLNDVFLKYFNSSPIDYMSVDTEGSELVILENFDFRQFGPKIITVEHNFTDTQNKLDELLLKNNYVRFFREYTQFDAWYVLQD